MLGRVVDPVAAGRRRPVARASRGDPSAARRVSAARQGRERPQEAAPAQARAARTGRDVATAPPPGTAGPSFKEPLGDALAAEIARPAVPPYALWSLGRLGARVPLYGPANTVVHVDATSRWVRSLLDRPFAPGRESTDAIFALSQLARVSGDRARDLDEPTRREVLARLVTLGADETSLLPVREYHELGASQQAQALGDALPVGLRLMVEPIS